MIKFSALLVIFFLSSQAYSQLYYSIGLKGVYSNFTSTYEADGEYEYNSETGVYEQDTIDVFSSRSGSYGPFLSYGYYHELTSRVDILVEGEMFGGFLRIPGGPFYFDFGISAGASYAVNGQDNSNVFARIGIGYGMLRSYDEIDAVGFNWNVGYEFDFGSYYIGARLTGNLFLEDFSYNGQQNLENLLSRKMHSVGLAVYVSIGKD